MSKRHGRTSGPRIWTTLVLAGSTAGIAAAQAEDMWIAPPDSGDATLWLAQTGGGEGGEGGAPETASPGAAYLIELGKLEAHLLAAARLHDAGAIDDARALASHPEAEFLPELREKLAARSVPDVTPAVEALGEALTGESGPEPALEAALQSIRAAAQAGGTTARDRYDAIVYLVRDSAAQYGQAIAEGGIADLVALEESRGFLDAAATLAEMGAADDTREKVGDLIASGRVAFPDGAAGRAFEPDASILHGVAARVEIATLRVK